MKRLFIILAGIILIYLEGCGTSKTITQKDYELGTEKTVTVGSNMLSYTSTKSQAFSSNSQDKGAKANPAVQLKLIIANFIFMTGSGI